ncbi:uncharacterized protein ACMZJ9_017875 [Mantella aurantiaca]
MRTTQLSFLLGLLLPLCTVVTSIGIKNLDFAQKPGKCPQERYYIKASDPDIVHNICKNNDFNCPDNMKCCSDNGHKMCKPPAQDRPGQCPTFDSAFASTTKCNDNCTSDSECPGNFKCCFKSCGKTCVPTLSDIGKPSTGAEITKGFCQQEALYRCVNKERFYCDENSCTDGYKCCPFICRKECRKPVAVKDGVCPASATCPPEAENTSCTSDYDCKTLHKCCATTCGQKCVMTTHVNLNIHDPKNPHLFDNLG